MQAIKLAPISFEEYLAIEQQDDKRYEFHDGYFYAMAGGTRNHGRISGNIFSEIHSKLKIKSVAFEAHLSIAR
ncbi:MAG: Uma2 family endonuclease [Bacteroidia bacterium]